jgi:hypothetical protein
MLAALRALIAPSRLEARLREGIMGQLSGVVLNGPEDVDKHRYPGNVNLSFAYVEGESLIMGLKVRLGKGGREYSLGRLLAQVEVERQASTEGQAEPLSFTTVLLRCALPTASLTACMPHMMCVADVCVHTPAPPLSYESSPMSCIHECMHAGHCCVIWIGLHLCQP